MLFYYIITRDNKYASHDIIYKNNEYGENFNRGRVTERVNIISKEFLGHYISTKELSILVYLKYTSINEGVVDPDRIDYIDLENINKWIKLGYMYIIETNKNNITDSRFKIYMRHDFFNFINEIQWFAYVENKLK